MIVVTGGAGFIGGRLVKALEAQGHAVVIVDQLEDGHKFINIVDCQPVDYLECYDFLEQLEKGVGWGRPDAIRAIFHQGACTDTTEWNGQYMMATNFTYSKKLLQFCLRHKLPFYYASSAAVYGRGQQFSVDPKHERPINVYGYSKLLFDQYVRQHWQPSDSQVVGLRYFNVYGPGEGHKGKMASVVFKHNEQLQSQGYVSLFSGSGGYADGEQRRDFIYVDDVVKLNLWFFQHTKHSGIFNVGTGRAQTFNALANAVINWHGSGEIRYVPFPDELKGFYQSFTEADIQPLRALGYSEAFSTLEEGVTAYLNEING